MIISMNADKSLGKIQIFLIQNIATWRIKEMFLKKDNLPKKA